MQQSLSGTAVKLDQPPPASILVVEDDRDSRDALQGLLELDGYHVRCAEDGAAALRAVDSFVPDVVILDINMPRMDGYTVCQHLRGMRKLNATLIFALTALDSVQHVQKCAQVGFDQQLTKPMKLDALRQLLWKYH